MITMCRSDPAQVLKYSLGDITKNSTMSSKEVRNENKEEVDLFPPKGKNLNMPSKEGPNQNNAHSLDECLGKCHAEHMDHSVQEANEDLQEIGSCQPPERNSENQRGRSRSPESINNRDRYRYDVTDRRYHLDYYDNGLNNSENSQLNSF